MSSHAAGSALRLCIQRGQEPLPSAGNLLASPKMLAEERATAKSKKPQQLHEAGNCCTLGHQPNVVAFMAICIALPKRICSSVYRCTNNVLVSLPSAVCMVLSLRGTKQWDRGGDPSPLKEHGILVQSL